MTVGTATKMWSRHDADFQGQRGRQFSATIREAYQVTCDPTDTLAAISVAPGLPTLTQLYPGTSQIRVTGMQPRQISPIYWIVEVTYTGNYGPGGAADSPLNEPPVRKWGKIESEEPTDQDFSGKPIVTANNEPIHGVTRPISDVTLTIERNFAAINLAATYQYLHSVNSDTFAGFAPGVVRLTQFSAEEAFAESIGGYWRVVAGFQMRWPYNTTPEKAWYRRIRHEGFKVKVGSEIVTALDKNLQPATTPVLLKADGTEETNPDNAHWLEWQIFQPLPYNALGLM